MPERLSNRSDQIPSDISEDFRKAVEDNQRVGAKVLSKVGLESRQKSIVDSSFNKALGKGEKLPGKNNERRDLAYLNRLSRLIDKYGNRLEKRLWEASIKDDMLVKEEDITDATWAAKKQEHRDNGFGNLELTDNLKHEYTKEWRKLQEESLEKWSNYLGDEHSPYPLWFKVYAWDGMTKMGRYNKGKQKYETRNKTTVAPYPDPDAEILGKVFEVVNRYHGNNERKFYTEDGERNINLEKLAESGNFAKIYNAIQQEIAPIVEPPEKAENVHGEWVEYNLGDEDEIAIAAQGTGWCIASSAVGRHYLKYGTYGGGDEDDIWDVELDDGDEDDYGEKHGEHKDDKEAKFILLHLKDPSTGKLSKNAVASIRLNINGDVAEISGLKDGQALNDSLIQIVEDKVKSLPGGEEFLPKFADKNELIRLDKKMQNGEDLTKEELDFIYEINRPINILDTYNGYDPRVPELKEKYNINYALEHGVETNKLIAKMPYYAIDENLDTLIQHGANIDQLVGEMEPYHIAGNLDTLIRHGANIDVDQLVEEMEPYHIARNLDALIQHGANIDIDKLVGEMEPYHIAGNLDTLIRHGANIDVDQLVEEMHGEDIARNLDALIQHGANIDQLVGKMEPDDIAENLDTLIQYGAKIDFSQLVDRMSLDDIDECLDVLIRHGIGIDRIVRGLDSVDIDRCLDVFIRHSTNIDQLVKGMESYDISEHLDTLIQSGANIDRLAKEMEPDDIAGNLDTLIRHGANIDIDKLVGEMKPYGVARNLDALIQHGANIDQLVGEMELYHIAGNLDTLIRHGANIDVDQLVEEMEPDDIARMHSYLLAHGANPSLLERKLTN